jgi:hypothetical protein
MICEKLSSPSGKQPGAGKVWISQSILLLQSHSSSKKRIHSERLRRAAKMSTLISRMTREAALSPPSHTDGFVSTRLPDALSHLSSHLPATSL